MEKLLLFIIAVLPVIVLGSFIYKKDKIKEPPKLIIKLFLGGILSCVLVLIISLLLEFFFPIFSSDTTNFNLLELAVNVFIGVAFVEEVCKWFMAYKISYNSIYFDEIYDAILYCCFVSLGFAFVENLLYVYEAGIATGILRALLAVPGHLCDGVFMGYYFGLSKLTLQNNNKAISKKYLMYSIIVPSIIHGIYDYCLFTEYIIFLILFLVFIIIIYINSNKKINRFAQVTEKIPTKKQYCQNCGQEIDSIYCTQCGYKNE